MHAKIVSHEVALNAAPGVRFGRYLIRTRIARGGMGEVFLADQLGPMGPVRPVALKRMLPKVARDPNAARMFLEEMATAAQLNHPNIATTYDFGEVDGVYFLAMEYVEGLSLKQLLDTLGPLPVSAALSIAAAISDALTYAHNRKGQSGAVDPVVHRDISPHNVMISTTGQVKLLDFGIARAEAVALGGRLEGKIAYAAPEQLRGSPADRRSDLWALGVMVYELLTGARPFEAADPAAMIERCERGEYLPIGKLRPEADVVTPLIERALRADPEWRWPGAETFKRAIYEIAKGVTASRSDSLPALVERAGGPRVPPPGAVGGGTQTASVQALSPVIADAPAVDTLPAAEKPRKISALWAIPPLILGLALGVAWKIYDLSTQVEAIPIEEPLVMEPTVLPVAEAPPIEEPIEETVEAAPIEEAPKATKTKRKSPRIKTRDIDPPPPAVVEQQGLGLLSVRAIPYAKVLLDGRDVGTSPLANLPLPSGPHKLEIIAGNGKYPAKTVEVRIRAGVLTRVVLDFERDDVRVEP